MAETDFRSSTNQTPPSGSAGEGAPITDALEETLGRLSKKAGVKATIVLDRSTGAILKTSGDFSQIRPTKTTSENAGTTQADSFPDEVASTTTNGDTNSGAEQLAAMVWGFIGAAGTLVEDLDTEDELRLLRLRTKKQELVIVPDPKYLLVVIHETLTPAS